MIDLVLLGCGGNVPMPNRNLSSLFINYRGKKIGEALLVEIFEVCYKEMVKYVTLEVRVSNTPAIGLYEKYSFKSLGTRKGYYQNNNEIQNKLKRIMAICSFINN